MKKVEDLQFPSRAVRSMIKAVDGRLCVQKSVEVLLSQCAVVTASFIACVSDAIREEQGDTEIRYRHVSKVFEGLGLFELAEETMAMDN